MLAIPKLNRLSQGKISGGVGIVGDFSNLANLDS
jgi:hypothetical protein